MPGTVKPEMTPVVEKNMAVLPIATPEIAASETVASKKNFLEAATPEAAVLGTITPDIDTPEIAAPGPTTTEMGGSEVPELGITTLEVLALKAATPEVPVSKISLPKEATLEEPALRTAEPKAVRSEIPLPKASPPEVAVRERATLEGFPGIATPRLVALETTTVGGLLPGLIAPKMTEIVTTPHVPELGIENPEAARPEFEIDSSPYATSSEDSFDTSSDGSDDGYIMLDPAEQARLLLEGDAVSDDEGGRKNAGNIQLRTANEKPDEIVEIPKVTVTEDMKIEKLGNVENIIENIVLVNAKTSGEYQVLESSSVLCLENRTVIGVISETIGRIEQPYYSVRFSNASAVTECGISKGTRIYYVPQHSTFVFTQALKAVKGSDASNIHDEEVGHDELEFSDDEAEAEYKRNVKVQRQARRGGRGSSDNASIRFPRRTESDDRHRKDDIPMENTIVTHLSYDDDDGLYTPLARPPNLHQELSEGVGRPEKRQADTLKHRGGRGRGDYNRGRSNDRGWGRGGRGGGQGRDSDQRRPSQAPHSLDLSLPPTPQSIDSMGSSQPFLGLPAITPQYRHFPLQSPQNVSHAYGQSYGQAQIPTQVQNSPFPPSPSIPGYQSHHQQHPQGGYQPQKQHPYQQQQHNQSPFSQSLPRSPSTYSNGSLPPGAFVNPAFFGNAYQHSPALQTMPPSYMAHLVPEKENYGDAQRSGPPASDAAFQAAQDKLRVLRQPSGPSR